MHRREFMRATLVGGATASLASLAYSRRGQPPGTGPAGDSDAKSTIGYIRREIPAFEIPPYQGDSATTIWCPIPTTSRSGPSWRSMA